MEASRAWAVVVAAAAILASQTAPAASVNSWPQPRSRNQEKAARRKAKKRGKR